MHCPKKPRKVVTFGWSRLTGHGDNGHNNKLVGLLSILGSCIATKKNKWPIFWKILFPNKMLQVNQRPSTKGSVQFPGIYIKKHLPSLKLTCSHLKIGHPKRKQSYSNHPFSGAKMLVSGRVKNEKIHWRCFSSTSVAVKNLQNLPHVPVPSSSPRVSNCRAWTNFFLRFKR